MVRNDWVFNAVFLGGGVGLNALGAPLRERRAHRVSGQAKAGASI
jgi:hypothetical protein